MGGVETGTVDLAKGLIKRGHKAVVISGGGRLVQKLEALGAKHYTLPVYKKSLFTILKMVPEVEKIIKTENIDIVHARSRAPAIIAFFAARRAGVRFITTAHGYYSTHIFSRIMGWSDFVIVSSTLIARHMMEGLDVPYEKIRLIPRGVDLEEFRFNPISNAQKGEYRIGVIGRITPIKGHSFFIQAVARAIKLFPKIKVLIVGEPPFESPEYKKKLESLVERLNIRDFVEFVGPKEEIAEFLSTLDLVVVPSVGQEAFGRVIIEAGAIGVPVIATKVGGVVDIIEDGKNGILVLPGDIQRLTGAILEVLKDRELAVSLVTEARKKVEKLYSLDEMAEKTLKVYEEALKSFKILVIKIGAIGDVILITPSLRATKLAFPESRLCVLVGLESRQLLEDCPYIDELMIFDRGRRDKGLRGILRFSKILRRIGFDVSIDFQNNRTSHLLARLAGVPKRYGYDNGKLSFLLNKKIRPFNFALSPVEQQFRLLKMLGISGDSKRLELWPREEDFKYIENFLKSHWLGQGQPLVGFNIGGSARWRTKRWRIENLARLCDMLGEEGIRTVITGIPNEEYLAKRLLARTKAKPIIAIGKTSLLELAALIKRCNVFVTGDSAPMHIASSMGTFFIAFFGPTDPMRHLEPNGNYVVLKKDLDCSPCYRPRCRKPECMDGITVEEVFGIIMEKIKLK